MKLTIKQWRKVKDITVRDMASKMGISVGSYLKKENDQNQFRVAELIKASEVLQVSTDDILFS